MRIILLLFFALTFSFSKTYTIFFASTKYEDVSKEYYHDIRFHTPDFYKVAIRKHVKKNFSVIIRQVPTFEKAQKVQKLLLAAGKYQDSYIKRYDKEPIYETLYVKDKYVLIRPKKEEFKQDIENSNDYITATVLYNTGQYKESYELFYKLFLEDNYNLNVNYFLAKSAFNIKDYDVAVAAFERVLILKPDFNQARHDYARVLFHLKQKKEAKKEFEILLAQDIKEETKVKIKKYLKVLNKKEKRLTGQAFFMAGIERSSNVNNGLDSTEYRLPGLGNILVEGEEPIADNAHFELVGLNFFNYINNQPIRFKNSFLVYNKAYQNETDNNLLLLSYKPSILYMDTKNKLSYNLELGVDRIIKKTDEDFYSYTISPKLSSKDFTTYLKYQRISYLEDSLKEKDFELVQFYGKLNLFKNFNYYTTVYNIRRIEDLRTDIDKITFGNGFNIFYNITENNKINLNYQFDVSKYKYENIGFENKREDKKQTVKLTYNYKFDNTSNLGVSYIYVSNDSNQDAYIYDEDVFRLNYLKSISW